MLRRAQLNHPARVAEVAAKEAPELARMVKYRLADTVFEGLITAIPRRRSLV